jgi:hypothetical protein
MKVGVCPTCQQGGIRVTEQMMPDEDPGRFEDGDVMEYVLDSHNHQGGQHCTGSGQVAQFVYEGTVNTEIL